MTDGIPGASAQRIPAPKEIQGTPDGQRVRPNQPEVWPSQEAARDCGREGSSGGCSSDGASGRASGGSHRPEASWKGIQQAPELGGKGSGSSRCPSSPSRPRRPPPPRPLSRIPWTGLSAGPDGSVAPDHHLPPGRATLRMPGGGGGGINGAAVLPHPGRVPPGGKPRSDGVRGGVWRRRFRLATTGTFPRICPPHQRQSLPGEAMRNRAGHSLTPIGKRNARYRLHPIPLPPLQEMSGGHQGAVRARRRSRFRWSTPTHPPSLT